MTECTRCERKCQLYICNTCIEGLRTGLRELPWWLDRLAETALGQVNLSDGGRRTTRRDVLHGDDSLASHIEPLRPCKCDGDCECDIKKARRRRGQDALAHALSAVRINPRASHQYDKIQNSLSTTIRDICETRSLTLVSAGFIGPLRVGEMRGPGNTAGSMALWLAKHVHTIASQDGAATFCDEIIDATRTIERIINRPPPHRSIGPCITDPAPDDVLDKRREAGDYQTRCNAELSAPHKAKSVTCPQCKAVHEDVEAVVSQNFHEMGSMNFTIRQLIDVVLPKLGELVPKRTLERWIEHGWLEVRGNDEKGANMVRLDDVRALRDSRPRNRKAS